jgi:hypothetical protein
MLPPLPARKPRIADRIGDIVSWLSNLKPETYLPAFGQGKRSPEQASCRRLEAAATALLISRCTQRVTHRWRQTDELGPCRETLPRTKWSSAAAAGSALQPPVAISSRLMASSAGNLEGKVRDHVQGSQAAGSVDAVWQARAEIPTRSPDASMSAI